MKPVELSSATSGADVNHQWRKSTLSARLQIEMEMKSPVSTRNGGTKKKKLTPIPGPVDEYGL